MIREDEACLRASRKYARLEKTLRDMGRVLVAFSGGADSTLLLRAAANTLGDNVLAVTVSSPVYPAAEMRAARDLARRLGVRLKVVRSREMDNPEFTANRPDRCYHCKKDLFVGMGEIAAAEGIPWVLDGSNADDLFDYRPGGKAARALGVRSPLQEAGLTKSEIRILSRTFGLPTWDKPAMACLASRLPYHTPIDVAVLRRVGEAEARLKKLGFRQCRVRHHGETARIEVDSGEIPKLLDPTLRMRIVRSLKKAGYVYITADLEGYRTGSLNAPLAGKKSSSDGSNPSRRIKSR